ncbi:hypothetical protein NUU61_001147 [Penicillium alfredii]|uniref:V-type ATPase, C subunit family protein n=1 Tax=Penicillium alfredii TaxID=1506179 RepID=A0A9W9GB01_9EURO|nr:uncharacterized protein NUU61_001147 [Penicillium alfredii]KAJ5115388.1 hypothetical protein NUU61_001147 [Penicillium alfredii]
MSMIPGRVPNFMPVRSALQQGLLRQSLSSHRAPSSIGASRYYATERNLAKGGPPLACTWLTKTPADISPDDILSSLPPMPASSTASTSVPLLLATPSFAHWLDSCNPFMEQCLNKLYGHSVASNPLYAVAAIVDKLPDTRTIPENKQSIVSNDSESEGLSVLVVGKENVRGKAAPPRRIRSSGGEESDLVVSLQTGTANPSTKRSAHEIGLRLANTIFVNGSETTLFGMRWAWDGARERFAWHESVDLISCVVAPSSTVVDAQLKLPLHPVSERRRVITSMGNILRQVAKSTDPTSTEPMPASSELEKELPRYIEENDIVDQRLSVWALVEKADNVVADQDIPTQARLTQSLRQGGKLHRVMSGGGGWGKKQGLLSLDPEVSFQGAARRDELVGLGQVFESDSNTTLDEMPPFFGQGMVVDDLSLLSQVATAGDFIQFFVSVEPTSVPNGVSNNVSQGEEAILYNFGVVSDIGADEAPSTKAEKDFHVVSGSFGALSEKAIAYSQPVTQAESSTKLDVPGFRVVLGCV